MPKIVLVVLVLLLLPRVYGASSVELEVRDALAKVAPINNQCWAYSISGDSAQGGFLANRDPRRDQLWRLQKSFGDQSEQTRQQNFQKGRARDEKAPISVAIDWSSIVYIKQQQQTKIYGFKPVARDSDEEGLIEHLRGRIFIDVDTGLLKRIEWLAPQAFQPRFGVTLEHFLLQVNYQQFGELLFPVGSNVEVKGVAMLVKQIERNFKVKNSQYFNTCTGTRL